MKTEIFTEKLNWLKETKSTIMSGNQLFIFYCKSQKIKSVKFNLKVFMVVFNEIF